VIEMAECRVQGIGVIVGFVVAQVKPGCQQSPNGC
jgi:hypothetical protein